MVCGGILTAHAGKIYLDAGGERRGRAATRITALPQAAPPLRAAGVFIGRKLHHAIMPGNADCGNVRLRICVYVSIYAGDTDTAFLYTPIPFLTTAAGSAVPRIFSSLPCSGFPATGAAHPRWHSTNSFILLLTSVCDILVWRLAFFCP